MIKRIVKMTFHPENVETFVTLFNERCESIRAMEGCNSLELVRGTDESNVFFTISVWDSDAALQGYRVSDLFKGIWVKTKALFSAAPAAWSTEVVVRLD